MNQDRILKALESPAAYPHEVDSIEVVETHISWVYLTGKLAYKIKKAIELPFVDFSTLARRQQCCHDEVRLNRRLAAELYLDVVPIGLDAGHVRVRAEPAVEYAVCMKQFPPGATVDALIAEHAPSPEQLAAFGRRLAGFHDTLPPLTGSDPCAAVATNLDEMAALGNAVEHEALEAIAGRLGKESKRLESRLAARERDGFVRECHGDLHLGNLALIDGQLTAFDCLEFDKALRTIDVIDEAAFLVMDFWAHDRPDLAFAFLNAYLEATGDFMGLRLLRFYGAHRALVRSKVAAIGAEAHSSPTEAARADRYLAAARDLAQPYRPVLVITHGLSGSGKTTVARALAGRIAAVHVRSDVERKRLHGLAADADSHSDVGRGLYGSEASARTYRRLGEAAEAALAGRIDTIVDAAFLRRDDRDRFRELARDRDADFLILACTASERVLRERITRRAEEARDASEATGAVLDHQLRTMDPLGDDERALSVEIDTGSEADPDRLAQAIESYRTVRADVSR